MTPLRQQLLDCMQVRHFSIRTQQAYVRWVYDLAKHTHRSPDTLQDSELKKYLWSLTLDRHLSSSTCAQAFHALNFFYGQVLGRTFSEQLLPPMKRQQKIPELGQSRCWVPVLLMRKVLLHVFPPILDLCR